jgi:hypothetical protein
LREDLLGAAEFTTCPSLERTRLALSRSRDGWVGLFEFLLFAASVFVFGAFLYVTRFTFPDWDDLYISRLALDHGVVGSTRLIYESMNARITANLIWGLVPHLALRLGWPPHEFNPVWLIAMQCCIPLFFYWMLSRLGFRSLSRRLILALAFSAYIQLYATEHFNFFFYVAGTTNYLLPSLFFFVPFLCLGKVPRGVGRTIFIVGAGVALAFWHELTSLSFLIACALLNAVEIRRYLVRTTSSRRPGGDLLARFRDGGLAADRARSLSFYLLCIAAVGFTFMVVVSAQYSKLDFYPDTRNPWFSLNLAAWRSERFLYSTPVFVVPFVLAFLAARWEIAAHPGEEGSGVSSRFGEPLVVGAATLLSVPPYWFIVAYAQGTVAQERIATTLFVMTLVSSVWLGVVAAALTVSNPMHWRLPASAAPIWRSAYAIALVAMVGCLLLHPRLSDLRVIAFESGPRYAAQRRARHEEIMAAKRRGENPIYVAPITDPPKLIALPLDIEAADPGRGPFPYHNRAWAEYYQVEKIYRASPDAPLKAP